MPRSATLADLQAKKDAGAPQNKGAYDFFVSIGDQQAADILKNARYAAETHLGEESDASHIGSVRCVFQFIEECNAIRRSLGLGELRVTSEMMAYAISDCNWSDTNRSHARQFNVGENLAWGYGKESYQLGGYQSATATANPFYGWYDEEKAVYDEAVASGSYPGLAGMSAFEVSRQYPDLYLRVGHYLIIIDSGYTVTGFAWNNVNNTFDQVFDNPAGPGGATYGVSEYRSLYETWYATLIDSGLDVKIDIARDSTTRAQAAYDDAYVAARSIDDARIEQREVDQTYTADMTDPDNGISGLAARKVWRSIP